MTRTRPHRTPRALGAAVLLLTAITVPPVALAALLPSPTGLRPTSALTSTTLLQVGALAAWTAWLWLLTTLTHAARDTLAATTTRRGPAPQWAQRLVATALLATPLAPSTVATVAALTPAALSLPTVSTVTSAAPSTPHQPSLPAVGAGTTVDPLPGDPTPARRDAVSGGSATVAHAGPVTEQVLPTYTVQPPRHGRHDTLWGIAARHLGDGTRYREIFTLNNGRPQADGRALTDPGMIRPGWTLLLPADAVGLTGTALPSPPAPAPRGSAPQAIGAPEQLTAPQPHPAAPLLAIEDSPEVEAAVHEEDSSATHAVAALLAAGFGLSALGAVAALDRHRRIASRHRPLGTRLAPLPPELRATENQLRRDARAARDPAAALRAALQLAASRGAASITAVRRPANGDLDLVGPRCDSVPEPFTAGADGWRLTGTQLEAICPGLDGPDPAPALTLLGTTDGTEHYLNLEAVGWAHLDADPDVETATEWLLAVAFDLAGAPWADQVQLVLPERLRTQLPELPRISSTADLEDLPVPRRAADDTLPVARAGGRCDAVTSYLLLGHHPAEVPADWQEGALDPRCPVTAITVASTDEQLALVPQVRRWALVGDELRGPIDAPLRPRTLTRPQPASTTQPPAPSATNPWMPAAIVNDDPVIGDPVVTATASGAVEASVTALLRAAAEPEFVPAAFSPTLTQPTEPGAEPSETPADSERDAADTGDDRPAERAVEIRLLGPVEIHGGTRPRRTQVLLLVLYLALHRRPVAAAELRDKLWPDRTPSADEVRQRVREARDSVNGELTGGPLRCFTPAVTTDWERFRVLARGGLDERRAALRLVRGRPLEDIGDDACAEWLDEGLYRSEMEAAIVDLALEVAESSLTNGDPDAAYDAARAGLRACPWDERLYRAGIRAARAAGAEVKAASLIRDLRAVLDLDIEPDEGIEPATRELVTASDGQGRTARHG